ncbi:MAG: heparinase II/III family protein, partial [Pseudomonadota bacterium]
MGARDRLAARVAGIGGAPASLVFTPGVFQIGDASVAARLAAGRLRLAGVEVDLGDAADPWDVAPPTPEWEASLHGFDWLDHYAASGAPWVREALAGWIHAWIARCGRGAGPGWKAEIAGRRAAAWARSGRRIVEQASPADGRAFLRAFARNVRFLRRRWRAAPQGLPRCRAVAGLVHGALALYGPADPRVDEAAEALAEAARGLHADGAPSRAPEDLAIVFAVLVAARRALGESGRMAAPAHEAALAALAADIRALRHPDGSLVRAQGGGAGDEAAIDHSLALLEAPSGARAEAPMGYRRIASGRAVVFIDAGPAPSAPTTGAPFLGLFSLEASFDREPIVVSCGPGARIGAQWRRPCRAAAAHSSLTFDEADAEAEEAALALAPADIASEVERDAGAVRLAAVHDGWLKRFGLTHRRSLTLA